VGERLSKRYEELAHELGRYLTDFQVLSGGQKGHLHHQRPLKASTAAIAV